MLSLQTTAQMLASVRKIRQLLNQIDAAANEIDGKLEVLFRALNATKKTHAQNSSQAAPRALEFNAPKTNNAHRT